MLEKLIVCIVAGLGAGIGTGVCGNVRCCRYFTHAHNLSGFSAYEAVGIALASDVLASAISAYTYGNTKTWM